jgi:plastocyanin
MEIRSVLRLTRGIGLGLGVVALLALPPTEAAGQGPPSTATVRFGNPSAGSDFSPASGHDRSSNAKDNAIPRTVVISQGGSVIFEHHGLHNLAVYAPGTRPENITTALPPPATAPGCRPLGRMNDDDANSDRLFDNNSSPAEGTPVTVGPATFSAPGRYLFICQVRPHFQDFNMYGWVIVQ